MLHSLSQHFNLWYTGVRGGASDTLRLWPVAVSDIILFAAVQSLWNVFYLTGILRRNFLSKISVSKGTIINLYWHIVQAPFFYPSKLFFVAWAEFSTTFLFSHWSDVANDYIICAICHSRYFNVPFDTLTLSNKKYRPQKVSLNLTIGGRYILININKYS